MYQAVNDIRIQNLTEIPSTLLALENLISDLEEEINRIGDVNSETSLDDGINKLLLKMLGEL
jgi:hypothetical protein